MRDWAFQGKRLGYVGDVSFEAASGRPAPTQRPESSEEVADTWHVIVLNDPVNLMSYVVMVFRRVFGFSVEKARRHMLEVHHQGRSLVWSGDRERAESYVHTLQQWQLTAVLERHDPA